LWRKRWLPVELHHGAAPGAFHHDAAALGHVHGLLCSQKVIATVVHRDPCAAASDADAAGDDKTEIDALSLTVRAMIFSFNRQESWAFTGGQSNEIRLHYSFMNRMNRKKQ
jgi:hypothetical protein